MRACGEAPRRRRTPPRGRATGPANTVRRMLSCQRTRAARVKTPTTTRSTHERLTRKATRKAVAARPKRTAKAESAAPISPLNVFTWANVPD